MSSFSFLGAYVSVHIIVTDSSPRDPRPRAPSFTERALILHRGRASILLRQSLALHRQSLVLNGSALLVLSNTAGRLKPEAASVWDRGFWDFVWSFNFSILHPFHDHSQESRSWFYRLKLLCILHSLFTATVVTDSQLRNSSHILHYERWRRLDPIEKGMRIFFSSVPSQPLK